MWSKNEKDVARRAFNMALEREGSQLLSQLKEMAHGASNRADIWRIHDFLAEKRLDIDRKYDYRYSVLIAVIARLVTEGWLGLNELEGLDEDKIAKIKMMASLE